jgi:hypothetical protein
MKKLYLPFFIIALTSWLLACNKNTLLTDLHTSVELSTDTLRFDTVFTAAGSVTKTFKIFNPLNTSLNVSTIQLMGGNTSPYHINVDGRPGIKFENTLIDANDSIYVFVTVNVNPTAAFAPFIAQDSIRIIANGVQQHLQLESYGQNARYYRNTVIKKSMIWDKTLPYVILGGVTIDSNATLTINAGTRIHLHADAPILVNGSLLCNGTKKDSITFQGDRLDTDYKDLPGSWPGIYFNTSSKNNLLTYTIVKNAYQGLVTLGLSTAFPKLDLQATTVTNIYETGIAGVTSSIRAVNCLITNCGNNILLTKGGNYAFTHCTVVSYPTSYIPHKKPVIAINNWDSTKQLESFDLNTSLTNCVFWGENGNVDDEIVVSKKGNNTFQVLLEHNLYKVKSNLQNVNVLNNMLNQPPLFDSIDISRGYFDYHFTQKLSPAINKGKLAGVVFDLDGKLRDNKPDIGCYEKQ